MRWRFYGAVACAAVLSGCAAVGPKVSLEEARQARADLDAKILLRAAEQQERAWRVGQAIFSAMSDPEPEKSYPEAGLLLATVNRAARLAYGLPPKQRGVVVLAVQSGGPAAAAGIQPGDVVTAIAGTRCANSRKANALLRRCKPGEACSLQIQRGGRKADYDLLSAERAYRSTVQVIPNQMVNASTDGKDIYITTGMMRFLGTDDELAVVIGHEAAHISQVHMAEAMGANVVSSVFGAALGGLAEVAAPGAGQPVANTVAGMTNAGLTRNFEREADYKGLLHAARGGFDVSAGAAVWERFMLEVPESLIQGYFSTHPSSPERLVRVRKLAESIAEVGVDGTVARYERSETVAAHGD